jgi:hypothetical protein
MNKILPIILVVVLSGCSATLLKSNPEYVITGNITTLTIYSAYGIAEKECKKHGKRHYDDARQKKIPENNFYNEETGTFGTMTFYCQKPDSFIDE